MFDVKPLLYFNVIKCIIVSTLLLRTILDSTEKNLDEDKSGNLK